MTTFLVTTGKIIVGFLGWIVGLYLFGWGWDCFVPRSEAMARRRGRGGATPTGILVKVAIGAALAILGFILVQLVIRHLGDDIAWSIGM